MPYGAVNCPPAYTPNSTQPQGKPRHAAYPAQTLKLRTTHEFLTCLYQTCTPVCLPCKPSGQESANRARPADPLPCSGRTERRRRPRTEGPEPAGSWSPWSARGRCKARQRVGAGVLRWAAATTTGATEVQDQRPLARSAAPPMPRACSARNAPRVPSRRRRPGTRRPDRVDPGPRR